EPALSVTQQDRDVVAVVVGGNYVRLAVAVDVAEGDKVRPLAGVDWGPGRLLERALAVAEQDGHRAGAGLGVRDDDVRLAVAVDVTHGGRVRAGAGGERRTRRRTETALPVAELDGHVAVIVVQGQQGQFAVRIPVHQSESVVVRVLALLHRDRRAGRLREAALPIT